jgi:hypothetical protein
VNLGAVNLLQQNSYNEAGKSGAGAQIQPPTRTWARLLQANAVQDVTRPNLREAVVGNQVRDVPPPVQKGDELLKVLANPGRDLQR